MNENYQPLEEKENIRASEYVREHVLRGYYQLQWLVLIMEAKKSN